MSAHPDLFPSLPVALRLAYRQATGLHQSGQAASAEGVYRRLLDRFPDHAEARFLLAMARLQQGDRAEALALFESVIAALQGAQAPELLAQALVGLGNLLAVEGRFAEALAAFEQAEQADPSNPDGAYNQGRLRVAQRDYLQARQDFQRVLALEPGHRQAIDAFGALLIKQSAYQQAIDHYQAALGHGVPLVAVVGNLASAYEMVGQADHAAAVLDQVVRSHGAEALTSTAHLVRSRVARRKKELQQAVLSAQRALDLADDDNQRCAAFFALGLGLDLQGDPRAAFAAFEQANRLAKAACDAQQMGRRIFRDQVSQARQMASPQALAALAPPAEEAKEGEALVFFVGFPRSGTTLMEQILEAHPRLATTMEASPLNPLVQTLGSRYPRCLPQLAQSDRAALRDLFWTTAQAVVGPLEGRMLVDKMPMNLAHLALIQRLFPAARVLVALRDPRDVVLSCYMQNFAPNVATVAFQELTSSAETYDEVMGLWLAQRDHLGLASMVYRYEDLIAAPTDTVRQVLDFLGVGWDPAVEHYREKAEKRAISTPSYRDVTAPLFTRAMGRWQAYRPYLEPVLPVLAPYVEAFGYGETMD